LPEHEADGTKIHPTLLTAEEIASRLAVSKSYVYQLMQCGELQTVRLGRAVRVRPDDLERFIIENLTGQRRLPT